MPRYFLPAVIWACACAAIAQPGHGASPGKERANEREQRRADLRNLLQANRQSDSLSVAVDAPAPTGRHLSPRELAEMRQQLRQQQIESRRSAP